MTKLLEKASNSLFALSIMPSVDNLFNESKDLVLSQWNFLELLLALTHELARWVAINLRNKETVSHDYNLEWYYVCVYNFPFSVTYDKCGLKKNLSWKSNIFAEDLNSETWSHLFYKNFYGCLSARNSAVYFSVRQTIYLHVTLISYGTLLVNPHEHLASW